MNRFPFDHPRSRREAGSATEAGDNGLGTELRFGGKTDDAENNADRDRKKMWTHQSIDRRQSTGVSRQSTGGSRQSMTDRRLTPPIANLTGGGRPSSSSCR